MGALLLAIYNKNEAKMEASTREFNMMTLYVNLCALFVAYFVSDVSVVMNFNGAVLQIWWHGFFLPRFICGFCPCKIKAQSSTSTDLAQESSVLGSGIIWILVHDYWYLICCRGNLISGATVYHDESVKLGRHLISGPTAYDDES